MLVQGRLVDEQPMLQTVTCGWLDYTVGFWACQGPFEAQIGPKGDCRFK